VRSGRRRNPTLAAFLQTPIASVPEALWILGQVALVFSFWGTSVTRGPVRILGNSGWQALDAEEDAEKKRRLPVSFVRCCIALTLFTSAICSQARAQQWDDCSPSPDVKTALDLLPKQTPDQTTWGFRQKQVEAIQALRRQHPDDVFVERRYINSVWDRTERPKLVEEFKARFMAKPESPAAAYLYAIALLGRESSESIQLLDGALD